jgi:hypothetical protein
MKVGSFGSQTAFCVPEKESRPHRLVARFQPNLHVEKHESAVWLLKS